MFRKSFNPFLIIANRNVCVQRKEWNSGWESVIGLEIHAQISSNSKLFSGAGTNFGAPINEKVAFLDAALPGTLPVLNKRCVQAAVKTAIALNCRLNHVSLFDRKHYFYADLPAGYQITQQRQPIAKGGFLKFYVRNPGVDTKLRPRSINLTQLQLEQDSGKSLHDVQKHSLIDLNRAGVALMEIVTEPELRTGEEAAAFVKELKAILLKIDTCDCKMEQGSMRVDASISIRKPGDPLGTRTEVKNISSGRFVAKAIEFEIKRQIDVVSNGGEVMNETRVFDYQTGKTSALRDKEKLHDYRFMPEPNLPPLRIFTNDTLPQGLDSGQVVNVDSVREELPELPDQLREKLVNKYGVQLANAITIVDKDGLYNFFESIMRENPGRSVDKVVRILLFDMITMLKELKLSFTESPLSPVQVGEIVDLHSSGVIAYHKIRNVFVILLNKENQKSAQQIAEENAWQELSDPGLIEKACKQVIAANRKKVNQYKKGKKDQLQRLYGSVMKETGELANPEMAKNTLLRLIQES